MEKLCDHCTLVLKNGPPPYGGCSQCEEGCGNEGCPGQHSVEAILRKPAPLMVSALRYIADSAEELERQDRKAQEAGLSWADWAQRELRVASRS